MALQFGRIEESLGTVRTFQSIDRVDGGFLLLKRKAKPPVFSWVTLETGALYITFPS